MLLADCWSLVVAVAAYGACCCCLFLVAAACCCISCVLLLLVVAWRCLLLLLSLFVTARVFVVIVPGCRLLSVVCRLLLAVVKFCRCLSSSLLSLDAVSFCRCGLKLVGSLLAAVVGGLSGVAVAVCLVGMGCCCLVVLVA